MPHQPAAAVFVIVLVIGGHSPLFASDAIRSSSVKWLGDYHEAMTRAEASGQMLLIWFRDQAWEENDAAFERVIVEEPAIATAIQRRFVAVKLPVDGVVQSNGESVELMKHPAFAEMLGLPGLAILDLTDPNSPHFRRVVSVYPFKGHYISQPRLAALLELPLGTLTQRTLIFAVRTHLEQPESARSHLSPLLAQETESHAYHQASITLQGHHNWESRFHAINARLPAGLLAQEVCAESWPGQTLVEAADDCVHAWRQSPGHWEAVRSRHALFGYDMQRGANGTWYATGIFARQH